VDQPAKIGGNTRNSVEQCKDTQGFQTLQERESWARTPQLNRSKRSDKAEVSGSSPLRPTHLTRGFAARRRLFQLALDGMNVAPQHAIDYTPPISASC